MLLSGANHDSFSNSPILMVTGKNIPPQPKVPSTSIAFGRGLTVSARKKSSSAVVQQEQQQNSTSAHSSTTRSKSTLIRLDRPLSTNLTRRSGSVDQLSVNFPKIGPSTGASTSALKNGNIKMCQCRNGAVCKCVPSMAFLEGIYVQNLQTQIEVLELENAYLRGATGGGELIHKFNGKKEEEKNRPRDIPRRRHSTAIKQREEDDRDETTKLFSFRTENRSSRKDKRVGFNTEVEERRERKNTGQEEEEDLGKSDEEEYGNEEIYVGELSGWRMQRRNEEEEMAAQIRQKDIKNKRLKEEKEELERRVGMAEGIMSGERRALMGENVELQRRLEGLTPLLAEKETKLVKLEQELEEMKGKMKDKIREMNAIKTNLEDRLREKQMHGTERERAEQRMKANLEMKNRELEGRKAREASLERELAEMRAKQEQKEENWRKEMEEKQKTMEEMNEEIAKMDEKMERTKREKEQIEAQMDEIKQKNDLLEMELEMAREKLAQEEAEMRELNTKNREWNLQESEHRSAQLRTQRELEALQCLSQSLANENKGLREERAELEDRIAELREKFHTREGRIRSVAELLNEFMEKYRLSSGRVRQQMGRQAEECEEFQQIVQKVRQIVSNSGISTAISPTSATLRPSTTTSSSNSPSQISSKTAKRHLIGRSSGTRAKSD